MILMKGAQRKKLSVGSYRRSAQAIDPEKLCQLALEETRATFPDTELDFRIGLNPHQFQGVLWGTSANNLGKIKGELRLERTKLWGNQGMFSIYRYRKIAMFVNLPFAPSDCRMALRPTDEVPPEQQGVGTRLAAPQYKIFIPDP